MALAMAQARRAAANGDVPVGALVCTGNGRILAACGNRVECHNDPTAHAEILAIRKACKILGSPRLGRCILVATLEPCAMCAAAMAHARIDGLIYGAADARAGAIVSALDAEYLTDGSHFWHMGGIMAAESAALLADFFAARRQTGG